MRTDITIDTKQVRLPLRCYLGYSKCVARFGDVISWQQGGEGRTEYGRVIGRIARDPSKYDGHDCTGHLVVATLFVDLTAVGERWVNPEWVLSCHDVEHVIKNMDRFLAKWPRRKAPELRSWMAGVSLFPPLT